MFLFINFMYILISIIISSYGTCDKKKKKSHLDHLIHLKYKTLIQKIIYLQNII